MPCAGEDATRCRSAKSRLIAGRRSRRRRRGRRAARLARRYWREPGGGAADDGAVHPVRAGAEDAAQAGGAELERAGEAVGEVGRAGSGPRGARGARPAASDRRRLAIQRSARARSSGPIALMLASHLPAARRRIVDVESAMLRYALRRMLWAIPTLFGISLVVFFVTSLIPDPASDLPRRAAALVKADPTAYDTLEEQRRQRFLDLPALFNPKPLDVRTRAESAMRHVAADDESAALAAHHSRASAARPCRSSCPSSTSSPPRRAAAWRSRSRRPASASEGPTTRSAIRAAPPSTGRVSGRIARSTSPRRRSIARCIGSPCTRRSSARRTSSPSTRTR